jgi:hypothetical protein
MIHHSTECCKSATQGEAEGSRPYLHSFEWLCSEAIERIARVVGITVDMDEPEQALVAAVERRVAALVQKSNELDAAATG